MQIVELLKNWEWVVAVAAVSLVVHVIAEILG